MEALSQDDARRLWERAAQIQAEALRRAEAASVEEAAQGLGREAPTSPSDGYALTHVRAAAIEAGIGERFVDAALADLRAEQALGVRRKAGWARRFVGNPPDAITVSRVVNAPVAQVLAAMESVMPARPFDLVLRDKRGDPASGGLLIFDIPGAGAPGAQESGFARQAKTVDLRQVYASVQPLGDSACEVTLRGPIAQAFGMTALVATGITASGGGIGFGLGSGLAAVLAGTAATMGLGSLAAVVAVIAVVSGIGTGAGVGHFAFRKVYQYALDTGERGLSSVMGAIAMEAEGGWGLAHKELPGPTAAEK
jgi:hypothetical protein